MERGRCNHACACQSVLALHLQTIHSIVITSFPSLPIFISLTSLTFPGAVDANAAEDAGNHACQGTRHNLSPGDDVWYHVPSHGVL